MWLVRIGWGINHHSRIILILSTTYSRTRISCCNNWRHCFDQPNDKQDAIQRQKTSVSSIVTILGKGNFHRFWDNQTQCEERCYNVEYEKCNHPKIMIVICNNFLDSVLLSIINILGRFLLYWIANEESLQTKKFLAKQILCKEKDAKKAKKNIGNKSLILGLG